MKKILIITPYAPYPPHKSGGIHALFNILKQNLKFKNQIDIIYYDKKDTDAESELLKYVDSVKFINLKKTDTFLRLKSLVIGVPYGIYQYDINMLNLKCDYDKIILDQPLSMALIEKFPSEKTILMEYDSMSLYFKRKSEVEKYNFISKLYSMMQSKYYQNIHAKLYRHFSKIYFVSKKDKDYEMLNHKNIACKFDYINLGVDNKKFNNQEIKPDENSIVFTGIMDYAPNKDAVIFFCKKVLPELIKTNPYVKFYVVGKNPDEEIKRLENENIIVTGFVDDVVEYISKGKVYVSPLRFGSGMKNKVLEAMSTSKAIVASKISIEGITQLTHNQNIYIAESVNEWVEYVNKLLTNDTINKKFSQECRKIILENYSWEKGYQKIMDSNSGE